tara:strand:- start:332 stop:1162 length:831 start_codon:yes stop_codon:yes gene_type:complete
MLDSSKYILDITKNNKPEIALILGSGLTNFFDQKEISHNISYENLDDFPPPTVKGHLGKLVFGSLFNKKIVCMHGRSHLYEGIDPKNLAKPIRVLKDIGCKLLIVTNAAGSIIESMPSGSLMAISDHINWSGYNPLIGINDENYGSRFFDMTDGYNSIYRKQLFLTAQKNNQKIFEGVYCMFSGPNFETPAEIKAAKLMGVSAVGMSTVPEVLVANHCSLSVVAISVITNLAAGMNKNKLSHQETLENAALAEKKLINLIRNFIKDVNLNDSSRNN